MVPNEIINECYCTLHKVKVVLGSCMIAAPDPATCNFQVTKHNYAKTDISVNVLLGSTDQATGNLQNCNPSNPTQVIKPPRFFTVI